MIDNKRVIKALLGKIPSEKLMVVPILLLMIDTKTWKFPEELKTLEFKEIMETIENCGELKEIFITK